MATLGRSRWLPMLQNIPSQTDEKPCTTKSLLLDIFYLLKETIQSRRLYRIKIVCRIADSSILTANHIFKQSKARASGRNTADVRDNFLSRSPADRRVHALPRASFSNLVSRCNSTKYVVIVHVVYI